jgi:hypothetical protein
LGRALAVGLPPAVFSRVYLRFGPQTFKGLEISGLVLGVSGRRIGPSWAALSPPAGYAAYFGFGWGGDDAYCRTPVPAHRLFPPPLRQTQTLLVVLSVHDNTRRGEAAPAGLPPAPGGLEISVLVHGV